MCPATHPFAYNSGNHCCKTNKEKTGTSKEALCDGSKIGFRSDCCENDEAISCSSPPCGNRQP